MNQVRWSKTADSVLQPLSAQELQDMAARLHSPAMAGQSSFKSDKTSLLNSSDSNHISTNPMLIHSATNHQIPKSDPTIQQQPSEINQCASDPLYRPHQHGINSDSFRLESLETSVALLRNQIQELLVSLSKPNHANNQSDEQSYHPSIYGSLSNPLRNRVEKEKSNANTVREVSIKLSQVFDDLDTLKKEMRPSSPVPTQTPVTNLHQYTSNTVGSSFVQTLPKDPPLKLQPSKISFRHSVSGSLPSKEHMLHDSISPKLQQTDSQLSSLHHSITVEIQIYVQQQIKLAISSFENVQMAAMFKAEISDLEHRIMNAIDAKLLQSAKRVRWEQQHSHDNATQNVEQHSSNLYEESCLPRSIPFVGKASHTTVDRDNGQYQTGMQYKQDGLKTENNAGNTDKETTPSLNNRRSVSPVTQTRNIDGDVEMLISKLKSKLDHKAKLARGVTQYQLTQSALVDPLGSAYNDMELRERARTTPQTHSYTQKASNSPSKKRTTYSKPTLASQMKSKPFR
ncbi:hypothetical protein QVD99_000803 [Batrachochytrium dendrobatidis]|nr:hypothetical protein QVD99_000803 [Batrachochytrium dendrobatidis]